MLLVPLNRDETLAYFTLVFRIKIRVNIFTRKRKHHEFKANVNC